MPAFASRRRPARFGSRNSLLQRAFDANTRSGHPGREKCGLGGKLEVNGVGDWNTTQAIKSFQMHVGLVADGVAGPLTRAAITNELSGI